MSRSMTKRSAETPPGATFPPPRTRYRIAAGSGPIRPKFRRGTRGAGSTISAIPCPRRCEASRAGSSTSSSDCTPIRESGRRSRPARHACPLDRPRAANKSDRPRTAEAIDPRERAIHRLPPRVSRRQSRSSGRVRSSPTSRLSAPLRILPYLSTPWMKRTRCVAAARGTNPLPVLIDLSRGGSGRLSVDPSPFESLEIFVDSGLLAGHDRKS
jgi:hypothetical protein